MKEKRKQKKGRKRRVWLLFDLAILALFFGLIYGALNSSWAHRYYFNVIQEKVGWTITVEDLSINPFLTSVKIKKVNVMSRSRRQLFSADSIKVRVSPLSIIRNQIIVTNLEVKHLFLDFEKKPKEGDADKKEEKKPSKFTVDYIRHIVEKITGSFLLKNLAVKEAEVTPVRITIHRGSQVATDIQLDDFSFYHDITFMRENEFGFKAQNLRINQNLIGEKIRLNSLIEPKRVTFRSLYLERPEGAYRLVFKARLHPDSVQGSVKAEAMLQKVLTTPVKVAFDLEIAPPHLKVDRLQMEVAGGKLAGNGQWNLLNQDYHFGVAGKELRVPDLIARFVPLDLPGTEGSLDIQAKGFGRFPKVRLEAELAAQKLAYEVFRVPAFKGKAELQWPRFQLQANLLDQDRSAATLKLQLNFDKTKTLFSSLEAQLNQLSLATHLADLKITGGVSGDLRLKGAPAGLGGSAQLDWRDGTLGSLPIKQVQLGAEFKGERLTLKTLAVNSSALPEIQLTGPLQATFGPQEIQIVGKPLPGVSLQGAYVKPARLFRIRSLTYQQGGRALRIAGEYRLDKTFQASVKGEVDAHILENYRAIFKKAEGGLLLDLRGEGSVSDPVLNGSLRFQRATIGVRGFGDPIRDLNGTVRIRHQQITLERIAGLQGDGSFQGSGTMAFRDFKPERFNLKMRGNALAFRIRGEMQLEFDADLSLVGAMPSPLVSGQVDIISGRYYKNFQLTDVVFRETAPTQKRGDLGYGYLNDWRWDLKIRNNGELKISNNVADVYLLGDLHLKGTTARPNMKGVITTGGGELHYLGHDLQIVEGTLEFRDPLRIRPSLSLEAQEEIAGSEGRGIQQFYTVKVLLEGPIDNLRTELSSIPPVDRSDVVSLLAFGMTQSELRARGSSRSAFAASLVAGSISSGIGASVGESVGLDVLRFETSEESTQAISGVAFGKNLSDRLSVEFYTDITPETAQRRIRSKYFLTDNIFLEGANIIEEQRTKFELNVSFQFSLP